MKRIALLFFGFICLFASCNQDDTPDPSAEKCIVDNKVLSKELANALIIGKWEWLSTSYHRRGSGTTVETNQTTGRSFIFEFTADNLLIHENDAVSERLYEIRFWGEGTNTVDEALVLRTFNITGESQGQSLLFLNVSGNCLTLVNSYNDAGGDLNFIRVK